MTKTVTSRFVLKGDNQLNSAFSAANRQLANLGKATLVAGAGMAAMFARGVITNTIAQEKAIAQLNATLKSTGSYTPELSQAMQDFASELQNVTTYGDDAIIGAQSLLRTFRNVGGEEFPRATKAILDTATALGTDLKSAAIQVGKALNDPKVGLSALSRSGITFSEQQKQVITNLVDTGRTAEAQKIILEELEAQFQGSAEAARNTFGGALEAVKNNFGDLLEVQTGNNGAIDAMNQLAATMQDPAVRDGFQNLATDVFEFLGWLVQVPRALMEVKQDIATFFGADENIRQVEDKIKDLSQTILELYDMEKRGWPMSDRIKVVMGEIAELRTQLAQMKADAQKSLPVVPKLSAQQYIAGAIPEGTTPPAAADPQLAINEILKARNKLESEYQSLIGSTRTETERFREQLTTVDQLYILGIIPSAEAYADLLERINDQFAANQEKVAQSQDQMTQFAIQGARNMQTAFADFLFDPVEKGFGGMVKGFAQTLRRMAAEAAASAIFNAIFSAMGNSSNSWMASIGKAFATRDSGGPGEPGKPYLIGRGAQPELFVPNTAGHFIPNFNKQNGSTNNVTVNIDARENDNPGRLLALVPVIQRQVENSIFIKQRRGYT